MKKLILLFGLFLSLNSFGQIIQFPSVRVISFTDGNVLIADSNGNLIDGGISASDLASVGAISYFLFDTASNIVGYKSLKKQASIGVEKSITLNNLSNGDNLIGSFVTDSAVPNLTNLVEGIFNGRMKCRRNGGGANREVYLKFELYKRATGGAETLLGTSSMSSEIIDGGFTFAQPNLAKAGDDVLASDDRLVWKFYFNVIGSGGNPDAILYYEGATSSRVTTPIN